MWIRGRAYFEIPSRLSDLLCPLRLFLELLHPPDRILEATKTSRVGTSVLLQPSSAPDLSAIEYAVCHFVSVSIHEFSDNPGTRFSSLPTKRGTNK